MDLARQPPKGGIDLQKQISPAIAIVVILIVVVVVGAVGYTFFMRKKAAQATPDEGQAQQMREAEMGTTSAATGPTDAPMDGIAPMAAPPPPTDQQAIPPVTPP
jgi:flagellar basal body-associated protein FliL